MTEFRIYVGAGGHRFVGDTVQGPIVQRISQRSGVGINSNRRDQKAAPLLHAIGLHTQQEVLNLHARGVPGFGPANPVNHTTHCGFNDGIAFRFWPVGGRIPARACGVDTKNTPTFCREARREGLNFTLTYPGSVGEAQHCNERPPYRRYVLPAAPLQLDSKGVRVRVATRKLATLGYLEQSVYRFGRHVRHAVQRFQRAHGLVADGIAGPRTLSALDRVYKAHRRQHRKPARRPPAHHPTAHLHKGPVTALDVSEHNGSADWGKVARLGMHEIAVARVSYAGNTKGLLHKDAMWSRERVAAILKAGLVLGTYAYLIPGAKAGPEEQVRNYIELAKDAGALRAGQLPPILDLEEAIGRWTGAELDAWMGDAVAACLELVPGRHPWRYEGAFTRDHGMSRSAGCPLWLPDYPGSSVDVPAEAVHAKAPPRKLIPRGWRRAIMWQFTDRLRVPGVPNPCDASLYLGNFSMLQRALL